MPEGPMVSLRKKIYETHEYLFPEGHTISIHHSTGNINALFYIRLGSLMYLTSVYIWSITLTDSLMSNIIYLTMQGYFLTWLYFLLCMQDYMINGFGKMGRVFPLSSNLKYYIQIIYQMAFCIEMPITVIFWGFLFNILIHLDGITPELIANNANIHAGPLICLSLDMIYNTFSFPKQHFIILLIFSFIYLCINLTYSLTVKVIYKPIDWVSFLSYILSITSVLLTYGMHCLGRFLYEKYKKPKLDQRITDGLIDSDRDRSLSFGINGGNAQNLYAGENGINTPNEGIVGRNDSLISDDL